MAHGHVPLLEPIVTYPDGETAEAPLSAPPRLDWQTDRRGDNAYLAGLLVNPDTRIITIVGDRIVIRSNHHRTAARLAEFRCDTIPGGSPQLDDLLFLGLRADAGQAVFALALTPEEAQRRDPDGAHLAPAVDLRSLALQGVLTAGDLTITTTAVALANWHSGVRHCGHCGARTLVLDGGWKRVCAVCEREQFPRTDPVVIMLVTAGDACVLGRQQKFSEGMYSALAGFIEPGETIEAAVARETREEIGLDVRAVHYAASQPWPFPHSLMIGCIADTDRRPLAVDRSELDDARWFSREEVRRMIRGEHEGGLFLPGPFAIAHWLVCRFAGDDGRKA